MTLTGIYSHARYKLDSLMYLSVSAGHVRIIGIDRRRDWSDMQAFLKICLHSFVVVKVNVINVTLNIKCKTKNYIDYFDVV